jgi:hypothetical protein
MTEHLDAAYRATSYVVHGPEGDSTIRIDQTVPALDDLLVRHGTRCWAFITACNPGSTPLPPKENRRRAAELERLIREAGYPIYPGEGRGDDRAWPPEPSLLVVGIAACDATALARQFGQKAIVSGTIGAAAQLIWI